MALELGVGVGSLGLWLPWLPGGGGRRGRSLSGPGGGNDPQTMATGECPSLFSEILVPPAAPHVLGSSADGASLTL